MKKTSILLLSLILAGAVLSAESLVERIDVVGNERVARETIIYYLSVKEGEYYTDEQIQRDFRTLWSTGFFANIKFDELPGTRGGQIIRLTLEENPVIRNVTYKTGKKVKADDITTKLKEKDLNIQPYSYYTPSRIQKVIETIRDLETDKGLLSAEITTEQKKVGRNEIELLIKINEGPKLRIADVVFEGETGVPANELRWAMGDNRPHNFYNWISAKDVYNSTKLQENLDSVKKKLQENGYMEATLGQPRIEEVKKKNIFFATRKMEKITVPIKLGGIYRVGEITWEGNKTVNNKGIQSLLRLKTGQVYSSKAREKSIEDMVELYRNIGHLYVQIQPTENLDPRKRVVNLTLSIQEGEIAYMHRLEIKGNTFTKDRVIRREMIIREGDRFSLALFKDSLLRVKQLGLVDIDQEPNIAPSDNDPTQMDVTMNVKEMQRNNVQFTAGYSGYEGTYLSLGYSTVNFLGGGENFSAAVQYGKITKRYEVSISEPYLFDSQLTTSLTLFKRSFHYASLYDMDSIGGTVSAGTRIFRYTRFNLSYTLQRVNASIPDSSPFNPANSDYDPLYASLFMGSGNFFESAVTPEIYYSTVDSPLTPTRGTMYSLSIKYSGTFLGGDIALVKPAVEFSHFIPVFGNHVIGIHAYYSFILTMNNSNIPYWEKFYLGGEQSIRGYDIYSIGPRTSTGNSLLGGVKALYFNFEYTIPIGGPLYGIFFYDVGNDLAKGNAFTMGSMYSSTGFEARVFIPSLRVPFRLIFSYNNKKIYDTDSYFTFRFAIGTTF